MVEQDVYQDHSGRRDVHRGYSAKDTLNKNAFQNPPCNARRQMSEHAREVKA